ncbi:hypothetical protein [Xanthomonas virus PB119]|nr:hypothetical protein [Xanthomonas virus PB119]
MLYPPRTKEDSVSQFNKFSAAVAARFAAMIAHGELYRLDVSADELWDNYLASFPAGTNEIFRERTEHDGSYDRSFIKRVGNVVAINKETGEPLDLWSNLEGLPFPYDVVAAELASYVERKQIVSLFRTKETNAGHKPNFEEIDGRQHMWEHFYVDLPRFVIDRDAGATIGQRNTNVGVMKRGLEEIKPEVITDVLELIAQNTLYRGAEHKTNLEIFQTAQRLYLRNDEYGRNILLWLNSDNNRLLLRNSVIGSLLTDLSDGMEMEQALRSFEVKVAPGNYKRPTALITPTMVQNAMTKINDLGLEPSLYRRHAKLSDLNINDVLWADASAKNVMAGSIGDVLMQAAVKKAPKADKAVEISIEDFMSSVVPKASSMELFVSNRLMSNFVNITAPEVADAAPLFKWNNAFGWSYRGNVTDSIKERVKAAGGNITADLRISLAWHNSDDLDLHCHAPGRSEIYFGNKQGILDVDMNAGIMNSINPVENLAFMKPKDGTYTVSVDPFSKRADNQTKPGFTIEIEAGGQLHELTYAQAVRTHVQAVDVVMKDGAIVDIKLNSNGLTHQGRSQKVSGVTTESFVRVSTLMLSPNYWGDQAIGNKHHIFLLEGAKTDETVRGIYNEFLRPELEEHRKVFEVLGAKTTVAYDNEQLAGLGFSSTVRAEAIIKVVGPTINQTYLVKF